MTEIVLPEDSNSRGTIFGGRVLALIDKCAAAVALRHARLDVATVSMDSVEFHRPVRVGSILLLRGWINAAFRSSMEIEVQVHSGSAVRRPQADHDRLRHDGRGEWAYALQWFTFAALAIVLYVALNLKRVPES